MAHDLIVIGAGPGGASAAQEAARLGLKVALVDRGRRVGGAFVHSSALPMHVLRQAALRAPSEASGAGPALSMEPLSRWIHAGLVEHLPPVDPSPSAPAIERVRGVAVFESPRTLCVTDGDDRQTLEAEKIVIATGSRPRRPPAYPLDGSLVCDEESILQMKSIPGSVTIVGAGYVGVEYACILARCGARVTLLDRRRTLLRMLDGDIGSQLRRRMEAAGIDVRLGVRVASIEKRQDANGWRVAARLEDGREISSERMLVALGRESVAATLDVARVGIECDERGRVPVDGSFRTACPNVYAVGDAIGHSLGGASAYQGRLAARAAAGLAAAPAPDIPISLYTIPEISMVGVTEETCRHLGIDYEVAVADYQDIARSHVLGHAEGILKIVFRRQDRVVLGVHVIGPEASELIHFGALMVLRRERLEQLADFPFSHPTLSQLYAQAARVGLAKAASRPRSLENTPLHAY